MTWGFVRMIPTALLALGLMITPCPGQKTKSQKAKPQAPPAPPTITLMDKTYHLGSFNQKNRPMWEFVSGKETIKDWTTLVTLIVAADAHTSADLDRLAQGIAQNYENHSGKILTAKTMHDSSGAAFNYIAAAFELPATHTYELNFVKIALKGNTAYILIYDVRISDPKDYKTKAKDFLNQHSSQVGQALEHATLPEISTLPRNEF